MKFKDFNEAEQLNLLLVELDIDRQLSLFYKLNQNQIDRLNQTLNQLFKKLSSEARKTLIDKWKKTNANGVAMLCQAISARYSIAVTNNDINEFLVSAFDDNGNLKSLDELKTHDMKNPIFNYTINSYNLVKDRVLHFFGSSGTTSEADEQLSEKQRFILDMLNFSYVSDIQEALLADKSLQKILETYPSVGGIIGVLSNMIGDNCKNNNKKALIALARRIDKETQIKSEERQTDESEIKIEEVNADENHNIQPTKSALKKAGQSVKNKHINFNDDNEVFEIESRRTIYNRRIKQKNISKYAINVNLNENVNAFLDEISVHGNNLDQVIPLVESFVDGLLQKDNAFFNNYARNLLGAKLAALRDNQLELDKVNTAFLQEYESIKTTVEDEGKEINLDDDTCFEDMLDKLLNNPLLLGIAMREFFQQALRKKIGPADNLIQQLHILEAYTNHFRMLFIDDPDTNKQYSYRTVMMTKLTDEMVEVIEDKLMKDREASFVFILDKLITEYNQHGYTTVTKLLLEVIEHFTYQSKSNHSLDAKLKQGTWNWLQLGYQSTIIEKLANEIAQEDNPETTKQAVFLKRLAARMLIVEQELDEANKINNKPRVTYRFVYQLATAVGLKDKYEPLTNKHRLPLLVFGGALILGGASLVAAGIVGVVALGLPAVPVVIGLGVTAGVLGVAPKLVADTAKTVGKAIKKVANLVFNKIPDVLVTGIGLKKAGAPLTMKARVGGVALEVLGAVGFGAVGVGGAQGDCTKD